MDIPLEVNTEKVLKVFQTMEYDTITEDTSAVTNWLAKRNNSICAYGVNDQMPSGIPILVKNVNSQENLLTVYAPEHDVKQKIDNSLMHKNELWTISHTERAKLINKFASEIKRRADFICKIESVARGLLRKDTEKYGVSLLIEYLQYYSSWTYLSDQMKSSTILSQIGTGVPESTVIYASDNTCLGALGFALGPALAYGCNIIFHVEPALSVCVAFLIQLSLEIGIPDGVLKLVPSGQELWIPEAQAKIYCLGDIYDEKFKNLVSNQTKEVLAVSNSKTPIIIFDDGDIYSACESVVAAVWEYSGMLPWSADTVFVQESIYSQFVETLKERLKKISVGKGIDNSADISEPLPRDINKLNQMISDASAQGIDIYPDQLENNTFQPTIFIGRKVYTNNVIGEYKNVSPAATIVAFRTPNEAVALANKSRQGFACSIWCNSIAIVNEITPQLDVGTVWVNSHGIIKASIPFTTYKLDGIGYIGGIQGFDEYEDTAIVLNTNLLNSIPNASLKAQKEWNNLSLDERITIFSKWAVDLEQLKSEEISSQDTEDFSAETYESVLKYTSINTSSTVKGFEYVTKREAVGIVACIFKELECMAVILGALLLGNAVVLYSDKYFEKYHTFSKLLPPQLLSVLKLDKLGPAFPIEDKDEITFINMNVLNKRDTKYVPHLSSREIILRRCTVSKNIWTPIGDSI